MKNISIFLALANILLSSCNESINVIMDKETFEKEWNLWNEQNIQNYQYIYSFDSPSSGPAIPYKITVRENEYPTIEKIQDNEYEIQEDIIRKSIPEVFDFINNRIINIENGEFDDAYISAIKLKVSYDEMYHHPKKVILSFDYRKNAPDGHGGFIMEIQNFLPLD